MLIQLKVSSVKQSNSSQLYAPSTLDIPDIPVATDFGEPALKSKFSCQGNLSTIFGTKKSASETTVITVASFYPYNSVLLQYSGLKYSLYSAHSLRGSHESKLNKQDRKQPIKMCCLLVICDWLKNIDRGYLSA